MAQKSPPPPSASSFLQKHTHHSDIDDEETASSVSVGATEIVSNLIEGIVGGGVSGDDDVSVNSMKHRKENSRSYDQRKPKMTYNEGSNPSSIPYRGFGSRAPAVSSTPGAPVRSDPFSGLKYRFRGLFSPRATDIQQLLVKLQTQFQTLELEQEVYALKLDGSMWDEERHGNNAGKNSRKDPSHPLNNPKLMTEVHFVGRKAIDPSIIELTTLLTNQDKFGCITELWLNNNLISDDGAAAIASFLQLPTCALVELWLGDNQIGPAGTTLLSAALSNNKNTKLKCLGLYLNPIGNGGATMLAQMLRRNHTLSTVDVHGCGCRGRGPTVLEGYGCKVVKGSDGTEYVARVVAPNTEDEEGLVTDQRLLDAIQTFVAFNRINPTREQAIRGIMSSNKQIQDDATGKDGDGNISKFLSELCNQPANEHLTDEEKEAWKDCEWERLYVEIERARAAKSALANRLKVGVKENEDKIGKSDNFDEEGGNMESLVASDGLAQDEEMIGRDLDDEVVQTDARSWCDLKMSITGSARANPPQKTASANGRGLYVISDADNEMEERPGSPPQSVFQDGLVTSKIAADSGELEKCNAISELERSLETVETVKKEVNTPEIDDPDYGS
eukprot:CAMPEP_0172316796 /NCGR_PEP_ID=MMETSP1058-20130122/29536_1 /TAXON_ID=83371 /ORGANISM="Detonula confervacea, Strain CCMP 353" /LENGTH=615 /DNA_ID=CAMNT_0013031205 /DNA_START=141 /DNA_END=1988 /DNA_ORIENTATION=+